MLKYEFIKKISDPNNPSVFLAEIDFDDSIHKDRRTFNIRTYDGLRRNTWFKIDVANKFVTTNLSLEEYTELVNLFVKVKKDINAVENSDRLLDMISDIGDDIYNFFEKYSLTDRIFDFIHSDKDVSLPDFANKELRPQDTKEKTFVEDEYHVINTIVIISKILFPMFGEIIYRVKIIDDSFKSTKEIVAFGIITKLLRNKFLIITNKLQNYIEKTIDKVLSDDPMIIFNGITSSGLTNYQFAKIIVKNFVNHNLYEVDGNIMRSLSVTLKRSVDNETINNNNLTYKERISPESGDDDQNTSFMENSINTINDAIEVPILVKIAIDNFIKDYLNDNNIDIDVFEEAVKYYNVTLLKPTAINELLVALFIADPIGSAFCVKYMNMLIMTKVVVLLQIYLMRHGFNNIVPLVSLNTTGIIKTNNVDEVDNRILISNGRSTKSMHVNYNMLLNEAISHLTNLSKFNFNEYMKSLMLFIVGSVHMYNVAPSILSLGNTGTTTKDDTGMLRYSEDIIYDFYHSMYHLLKIADPKRSLYGDVKIS